jgi:hypothetical protein
MPTPIYDLTDIWANPATVFNGIKINVNNAGSAVGSRLMRLEANGVPQFQVDPVQGVVVGGPIGGSLGPGFVNALGYFIDGVPVVSKSYVDTGLAGKQPADPDLTALAALTGVNVLYYRSAPDTWSPVSIGAGISFAGGILKTTGGVTGTLAPLGIQPNGDLVLQYNPAQFGLKNIVEFNLQDNLTLPGVCSVSVGPAANDNSLHIATTGFVKTVAQPLDGDLTSLSAAAGTNTIYYRSGTDTWTPVVIGGGLSFAGGTLAATAGGGNVSSAGTPAAGQVAVWTDSSHIQGLPASGLGLQPQDGDLTAISALTGTNVIYYRAAPDVWSPVIIGTGLAFGGGTLGVTGGPFQPLDADLTAIAARAETNAWFYRSGVDTWAPVTIGANLTFTGGVLAATGGGGGGGIPEAPADNAFYARRNTAWSDIAAAFATLASPTFSGDPKAPTPPITDNDTSIATTAFVKSLLTQITDSPPSSPVPGQLWWESDTGVLWIYFQDVDSSQWVAIGGANSSVGLDTSSFIQKNATTTVSTGYSVAPANLGTLASFAPNPALGNYQYGTNGGAFTISPPTIDCAIDILITNGATAGTVTFSGYTVGPNVGDAFTFASSQKFIVSIRRINAVSTYTIRALQ